MTALLALLFFLIAALYAAVGHGGGSGYLAVMGLVGLEPEVMRTTALTLNVLVTAIATWRYVRAGYFSGQLFWPIAAVSVPFAFLGGRLAVPTAVYGPLVGLVLLYAAVRLALARPKRESPAGQSIPLTVTLIAGVSIGLVSGLLGLGGGIFLAPLLLLSGWADTRQTMGITAAFVLVNSLAALLGRLSSMAALPEGLPLWLAAVAAGGWLGAELGSRRLNPLVLRRLLAGVLALAGGRMLWG